MVEMLLDKERPIVAVLGPSLSRELIVTGQIAPFYNVIEVRYVLFFKYNCRSSGSRPKAAVKTHRIFYLYFNFKCISIF